MKLVNWHRLIKNPLPVFFLILDFGSSDSPLSAYLVPLDETAISRALRRIRKLDSQSKNISRHKLNVLCFEEHRLEIPNGEAFERAIRSHIGLNLEEYIRRKALWRETVGYESGKIIFRFDVPDESLNGMSFPEVLVDLSLGLRGPLAIGHAELRDVRFDIPAREPIKEYPSGTIEIIPEPVEIVEVTLRFGASVVRTKMDMFLPCGLGDVLEVCLPKMRLKSKLFELVDCGSRMDISIRLPEPDARVRLADFHDLARTVLILRETATSNEGATFTVQSSQGLTCPKTMSPCIGFKADMIDFAIVVQDAWVVARHLEIEDRVELTMEDLMLQKERLSALRKLLAGEALRSNYRAFVESGPKHDGERTCALHPIGVILGDYLGTIVISLWGAANPTGRSDDGRREYEIFTSESKVEKAFTTTREEDHSVILGAVRNVLTDTYKDIPCVIFSET